MPDTTVTKARYYPAPPPGLPGESADDYTNRVTGADGTDRAPYDHRRFRQCSIGYHLECSQRSVSAPECECPCHTEQDYEAHPTQWTAVSALRACYDVPTKTAARVVDLAVRGVEVQRSVRTLEQLAQWISAAYDGSPISEYFAVDVARIVQRHGGLGILDQSDRMVLWSDVLLGRDKESPGAAAEPYTASLVATRVIGTVTTTVESPSWLRRDEFDDSLCRGCGNWFPSARQHPCPGGDALSLDDGRRFTAAGAEVAG